MVTLTQKERMLLEDAKKQEENCIEKYTKYSSQASDQQLKNLFNELGGTEKQHLDTINQILSGTVPAMNAGAGQAKAQPQFQPSTGANKQADAFLCNDALTTEKHVSSVYNTSIFEFRDTNIRQTLNHIQKEEQEHGEKIWCYMSQNGMYN